MKKSSKTNDFVVFKAGGKQHKASVGQIIKIEHIREAKEGETLEFADVLLTSQAGKVAVGAPTVAGSKVVAKITKLGRYAKVISARYKAKSNRLTRRGHRQPYVEIQIESVK